MIRFLSQKLKSQSLSEDEPDIDSKLDEDRDSGTESDDENVDLELQDLELTRTKMDERNQHDTSSYGSLSPPLIGDSDTHWADNHPEEPEVSSITSLSFTSTRDTGTTTGMSLCDLTNLTQTWDTDRHSSEDELININNGVISAGNENDPLISERGVVGSSSGLRICDSAGSSDDEVREFMLQPQPVMFACSPPPDARRIYHSSIPRSPALITEVISPLNIVSPRKRHRQTSTADLFDEDDAGLSIRRPCLDFEKMQKTIVKKQCTHSLYSRTKVVRIRTISSSPRSSKYIYDPSVFAFRSISMTAYSPLTPVEEPPCAY